jgi:hypothetical protein
MKEISYTIKNRLGINPRTAQGFTKLMNGVGMECSETRAIVEAEPPTGPVCRRAEKRKRTR